MISSDKLNLFGHIHEKTLLNKWKNYKLIRMDLKELLFARKPDLINAFTKFGMTVHDLPSNENNAASI